MDRIDSLATDSRSLDGLRQTASRDPKAALRKAAEQFEAVFMRQLLKSMRAAVPKSGMLDGDGKKLYEDMLDDQLATRLSGRPGGLASMIERQLGSTLGLKAGATPPAGARAAPAADASLATGMTGGATQVAIQGRLPASLTAALEAGRAATGGADARRQFVDRMWPHAVAAQARTGVRAEFIVGQAALESGWGKEEIRHPDGSPAHNLFGIKAGASWRGPTVDVTTTEYANGVPSRTVERFRAYGSYAESFADWAGLMRSNRRYEPVMRDGKSAGQFAAQLQEAGYATDPAYARKLERTIETTLALRRARI